MPLRLPPLPADPRAPFPPVELALRHPDGLLAIGGDLSPARLLTAYRSGVFPWFGEGQPILWWSPDPRTVFHTGSLRMSSRLRRSLKRSTWQVRADTAFESVIDACAHVPRNGQDGTWITAEMRTAYIELHRLGHAHSVEVWDEQELAGGIYGVAIGRMFFGESMFSHASGGSKVALAALARTLSRWGWPLVDAQVENPHLVSLGATQMPRGEFVRAVAELTAAVEPAGQWTERFGTMPVSDLAASFAR